MGYNVLNKYKYISDINFINKILFRLSDKSIIIITIVISIVFYFYQIHKIKCGQIIYHDFSIISIVYPNYQFFYRNIHYCLIRYMFLNLNCWRQ
jgi:hypothetical protein